MEHRKDFRGEITALQHQQVLTGLSFHVFLSHLEPVATTGRTWSQPLVVHCVLPCLSLMAGVLPRATVISCSKKKPPLRNNLSSCLTGQRATESVCHFQAWQQSWAKRGRRAATDAAQWCAVYCIQCCNYNKNLVWGRLFTWDWQVCWF